MKRKGRIFRTRTKRLSPDQRQQIAANKHAKYWAKVRAERTPGEN